MKRNEIKGGVDVSQFQKGQRPHMGIPSVGSRNPTDHFYWDFFIYSLVNWMKLINSKTWPEIVSGEHAKKETQKNPSYGPIVQI